MLKNIYFENTAQNLSLFALPQHYQWPKGAWEELNSCPHPDWCGSSIQELQPLSTHRSAMVMPVPAGEGSQLIPQMCAGECGSAI